MEARGIAIGVGYVVGLGGMAAAFVLLLAQSSVFADAIAPDWTGPGIDVFVDPFVLVGTDARIEVIARGGDRAGVEAIAVDRDGQPIAGADGSGVVWGSVIQESDTRGQDSRLVPVPIPADAVPGKPVHLDVRVDYVVAMGENGTFDNVPHRDEVAIDVVPHDAEGLRRARFAEALWAFADVVGWIGLWAGYFGAVRALDRPHDTASDGLGLAMPAFAIAFLGGTTAYWRWSRPLAMAFGGGDFAAGAWTVLFLAVGPVIGWRISTVLRKS